MLMLILILMLTSLVLNNETSPNKMKCHWYLIYTLELLHLTLALAIQLNIETERKPFISKQSIHINRLCFVIDTGSGWVGSGLVLSGLVIFGEFCISACHSFICSLFFRHFFFRLIRFVLSLCDRKNKVREKKLYGNECANMNTLTAVLQDNNNNDILKLVE